MANPFSYLRIWREKKSVRGKSHQNRVKFSWVNNGRTGTNKHKRQPDLIVYKPLPFHQDLLDWEQSLDSYLTGCFCQNRIIVLFNICSSLFFPTESPPFHCWSDFCRVFLKLIPRQVSNSFNLFLKITTIIPETEKHLSKIYKLKGENNKTKTSGLLWWSSGWVSALTV